MILNEFNDTIQDESIDKIGVNVNNLTFNLMIDGIYTNKLHSVIREICTNARDSITEAGKGKVVITLTQLDTIFTVSIKDTGLGLSEQDAKTYLCNLNASSKRNSNNVVGCFGIGSKSVFALASQYRYKCVKDGVQTFVDLFRIEKESPRFVTTVSPTDEEDQVECVFNIKSEDIHSNIQRAFQNLVVSVLSETCLFDVPIELYLDSEYTDSSIDYYPKLSLEISTYQDFYILARRYLPDANEFTSNVVSSLLDYIIRNKKVSCGVVAYNYSQIPYLSGSPNHIVILKTELGLLSFDSSRENIEDTSSNNEYIISLFKKFADNHLNQIRQLTLYQILTNKYTSRSADVLPRLPDGNIDYTMLFRNVLNILDQYIDDQSYRSFIYVLAHYLTIYSSLSIRTMNIHGSLLANLLTLDAYFVDKEAYRLTPQSAQILAHALRDLSIYMNLSSHSKYIELHGSAVSGVNSNRVIFLLTNEKVNPLSRVTGSLSPEESTLVCHLYIKKEGFQHPVILECSSLVTEFLRTRGFNARHFIKLRSLKEIQEFSKYYDMLKPETVSRTTSRETSAVQVNDEVVSVTSTGLVPRLTFDFPYYSKNNVLIQCESFTSARIRDAVKRDYSRTSFAVLFVSKDIIDNDQDRDEFLLSVTHYTVIFEYMLDIPEAVLEPLINSIKENTPLLKFTLEGVILKSEDIVLYKSISVVHLLNKKVAELNTEFRELFDSNTRSYFIDNFFPLKSINMNRSLSSLIKLIFSGVPHNIAYFYNNFEFLLHPSVTKKFLAQEDLQAIDETVEQLLPSINLDLFFETFKDMV